MSKNELDQLLQDLSQLCPKQYWKQFKRNVEIEYWYFIKLTKEEGVKIEDNELSTPSFVLFLFKNDMIRDILLLDIKRK